MTELRALYFTAKCERTEKVRSFHPCTDCGALWSGRSDDDGGSYCNRSWILCVSCSNTQKRCVVCGNAISQ